jgi:hypothetical protein
MKVFNTKSKRMIKLLINESLKAIYDNNCKTVLSISKNELDSVMALMQGINPKNEQEKLYAAQIVICFILGMRKLAEKYKDDQKIGLDLLNLQNMTIQNLVLMR